MRRTFVAGLVVFCLAAATVPTGATPTGTPTPVGNATATATPDHARPEAATPERRPPDAASTDGHDPEEATPFPTTTFRTDDGLGTALAYAAIFLLSGLGLLAALVAALALAYGRVVTDRFADWETALFSLALVGGLYAALRGFTFDASGGDRYALGPYAALGAAGLVAAWLLCRPLVWAYRRTSGDDAADGSKTGDGDGSNDEREGGGKPARDEEVRRDEEVKRDGEEERNREENRGG